MVIPTALTFLAPFALFFQQVRSFLGKILHVFLKSRTVPPDFRFRYYKLLKSKSVIFSLDDYKLLQHCVYSKKNKLYYYLPFKVFKFEIFLYKNFIPVFVSATLSDSLKIQYLKFTFPFEKLLNECCEKHIESVKQQSDQNLYFDIIEKKGESSKKLQFNSIAKSSEPSKGADSAPDNDNSPRRLLYLSEILELGDPSMVFGEEIGSLLYTSPEKCTSYLFTETGNRILEQVSKWLGAREWYDERNIVWKRSILLNGKPGNGKSSLIVQIARQLKLPVYTFDLSSMDNEEFSENLASTRSDAAIILFEDIDSIFEGRVNIAKNEKFGGLTFDYFINKLEGVAGLKNKFVFITTNHLEKLDPALIRSGRVDEIIHIEPLTANEKRVLAKNILGNLDLVDQVVYDGAEDSTADFQNRCIKIALNNYWGK